MHKTFLSGLFLFAFASALLTGFGTALFDRWTCGAALWPAVIPPAVMGFALVRLLRGRVGAKTCAALSFICVLLAFAAFGSTEKTVHDWLLLPKRIGLTYGDWYRTILGYALLWIAPGALFLPFLLFRNGAEDPKRGKLAVFFAACSGLILARIGVAKVPSHILLDIALNGMLFGSLLLIFAICGKNRLLRISFAFFAVLLLLASYFGTRHAALDPMTTVHPFAVTAARDVFYQGIGSRDVVLKDGRVVYAVGIDEAARTASQLLPLLLRPQPSARIAARPAVGAPRIPTYETGELKGLYDAIWVDVPPAWIAGERDYFGTTALHSVTDHLKEDGLLIYVLDARALDSLSFMIRYKALNAVFPYIQIWMTGLNDWQLVASRKPITLSFPAMASLMERPGVVALLESVGIPAPIYLLPSCIASDTKKILGALEKDIPSKLPRFSATAGRRLLFDGAGSRRLLKDFASVYEDEMPWIDIPAEIRSDVNPILASLRAARKEAMNGKPAEASRLNPNDTFLMGMYDRDISSARSLEKLADHGNALRFYASAFGYVRPKLHDVLDAANIAHRSVSPAKAEPFYTLAERLSPDSPLFLTQYAAFLYETKRFKRAEDLGRRILKQSVGTADNARSRFFIARCIAQQPGRMDEGVKMGRFVTEMMAEDPKTAADFVNAYGNMLIECGRALDGVAVKRHFRAYGKLLPAPLEKKH